MQELSYHPLDEFTPAEIARAIARVKEHVTDPQQCAEVLAMLNLSDPAASTTTDVA